MTKIIRLGLVGALMMLVCVTAAQAQDVSGTWQFTVELDVGGGRPTFVFVQYAESLTGTYEGTFGSADVTGTIKGTQLEFQFELDGSSATYTGTVAGETMSGTCKYDGVGSGVWEAERADEQ